jgi:hypothetical protein
LAGAIRVLRASYERSSDDAGSTSGTGGASICRIIPGQVECEAAAILARTEFAGFVELAPRHQAHHTAFVCLVPTVAASEAVGAFAGHLRGPPIRRPNHHTSGRAAITVDDKH